MPRFKDLADPALAAEWRRRARDRREAHGKPLARDAHAKAHPRDRDAHANAHLRDPRDRDDHSAKTHVPARPPSHRSHARPASATNGDRVHEDVAGFASLIGPVQPLGAPRRHRAQPRPPAPRARQREADEEAALRHSQLPTHPGPMAWDVGLDIEGAQSFVRPGLNPDLLRKLRRGHWVVQAALDLHRHTQEEARLALSEFLATARRHGWRCVRVIHGKGLSSPNREPVLKAKVRKWLQQRAEVLAYCEPRPHAGGGGAVVVLLNAVAGRT